MKKTRVYHVSFRCYYEDSHTQHHQEMPLKDIPKWLEAYKFTHPDCKSISIRFWFSDFED